ncbi:SPOR domain-containing protein [Paenibacillus sp. LHD-38]|uniref:SPOR domain-containing protein n=1 Tax=Paenibacillus sp. LHD-38 TaxID=3072143 RepID=UPI00280C92A6|nr:SPOR domain-containing protein [Paenibacillus sp. LHD-38]MDQ8737406.1 SPOR domain-containing protein [Paenibacillus sp. LHD-38]
MTQKNRITYRFDRNGQTVDGDGQSSHNQQEVHESKTASTASTAPNSNKSAKMNVIPLYPSTEQHAISEVSPWNSPFQEDIAALEQLIRNADAKHEASAPKQTIAPKKKTAIVKPIDSPIVKPILKPIAMETNDEQENDLDADDERFFSANEARDTYRPYEDEHLYEESRNNKLQYSRMKSKTGAPSWFNVFLSVAAALATGALFGYLLLSLFTGASIFPGGAGNKPDSQAVTGSVSTNETGAGVNDINEDDGTTQPAVDDNSEPKPDANTATVSLKGLDRTYYMLQFGVFSNTEGRDAALDQLAKKGLAGAAMTSAADYRVYAGMGSDRSKAQTVRGLLPDIDLYVKEVSINYPEKIPFTGKSTTAQSFFEQTGAIVQMLDELTLAQLEQPALSPLSKAAAASWQAEHQKWTENAAAMRIGIGDTDGKAYLDQIIQAINSAAKTMIEYDKKPSHAHLWSTQKAVMNAVIAQKEWFESINAL